MDSINTGLLSELRRHFADNLPGSLMDALCTRGQAAGFADYLTKPLDMIKFHAVVDKLLESKKS